MNEIISYQDFIERTDSITGFMTASLTDEYIIDRWPMVNNTLDDKMSKVLEIRVFNDRKECKLFRSDIGKPFSFRVLDDDNIKAGIDRIEDSQFLDIDAKRSQGETKCDNGQMVYTTGGGQFFLPISNINNAKVKIVYYIEKDEKSGEARITDWRVAGFQEV